jgi:WD40 repeat protein
VWSPNGRYLACTSNGVLSVYSVEGGLNPLKMCSGAKKYSFSPRESWLVAECGDEQVIVINMSTHASRIFTLGGRYSSSIWSDDEAFLVVHCEGSNKLSFFARETSDIFSKMAFLEEDLTAQFLVG